MKKIKNNIKTNNIYSFQQPESANKIKTTNVNILLNRVRMDQKKDFKKKMFLFVVLLGILGGLTTLALL